MSIVIRKALTDDYADIARISRTALGYLCEDELVRRRLSMLDEKREIVFAAEHDGEVVGYIHAEQYDLLYSERLVNILGLAVDESCRRRGVGKMLLDAAEQWARECGAAGMRLNSGGSRYAAHEFYRAVGYDKEKQQIRFMKMF